MKLYSALRVGPKSHVTGIILAGGASARMGHDKATLPWGEAILLEHLVNGFYGCLQPLIIAGQVQQARPTLPEDICAVNDLIPHQGPLVGFLNGLQHAPNDQSVFLTGCDFPFLQSRVIDFLLEHLNDSDAVVPIAQGEMQPLIGLYRPGLSQQVQQLVDQGARSMHALLKAIKVNVITDEQWRTFDPTGIMLTNINTPNEYRAAHHTYLASLGA